MSDERYVFPAAIEGILRGLGPVVGRPVLEAHLLTHGIDPDDVPPAIPYVDYEKLLLSLGALAWPGVPLAEAMRLTGFHVMQGLLNTTLGSAVAAVLRLIGPLRSMKRLASMFRTGDNFMRAEATILGPNEALISLNFALGGPTYFLGIFQAATQAIHPGKVVLERAASPGLVLRYTWP